MKFINDIINHWSNDWHNNRTLFWLEIIGTTISVSAALIMSILATHPPLILIYSLWLLGNSLLIISSYIRGASWWIFMMLIYTATNIVGLVRLML